MAHSLAEIHAPLIQSLAKDYSHVVAAHSIYAKNIFPRVAALLDVSPIVDVIEISSADEFKRPIYAGNAIATVKSKDKIKLVTVRPTAFPPVESTGGSAKISEVQKPDFKASVTWISDEITKSDRPELGSAKVVISGGRGMKNGENFDMLYKLADKLGGAGNAFENNIKVGASRAAVDAGFVSNDLQIGQTGKIVAPQLYIAVGLSGAIQVDTKFYQIALGWNERF